jgi:hypothetical protein
MMVTVLPAKLAAANALEVAKTIAAVAAVSAVTAQRVTMVLIEDPP